MSDTIEEICYQAHKIGKMKLLLKSIPKLQQENGHIPLNELYQKAYDYVLARPEI